MGKKTHNTDNKFSPSMNEIKKESGSASPAQYVGAEWNGPDGLFSPDFGKLIKGQTYSLDETRAKNSTDWTPVYVNAE